MSRLIERLLIVAASVAVAVGVVGLLSGGLLAGRDNPGVTIVDGGPGVRFADQGDTRLRPGELEPVYDSDPPTSGPHIPVAVRRDGATLSNDQLLSALQVGNVVMMYGTPAPPPGLAAVARAAAPPFTPALAATGQTIILAQRDGIRGVVALAWMHMLRAGSVGDPALRTFAQFWLGRGAGDG
ncbi:MAG: DUF3105 domain-containing protein [Solirubrobacteraceae bacterium]